MISNPRFKDLKDVNMFSFLQQKSTLVKNNEQMAVETAKLRNMANPQLTQFGHLFSSKGKSNMLEKPVTIGFSNSAFSTVNMVTSNSCRILYYLDKPFSFLDRVDGSYAPFSQKVQSAVSSQQPKTQIQKDLHQEKANSVHTAIDWQKVGQSTSDYKLPSFWEDLDPLGSRPAVVGSFGIITPERENDLRKQLVANDQNCWKGPQQTVSHKYYRKSIDMMLMGIEGQVFSIDKFTGIFTLNNFNSTIDCVTGRY